MALFRGSVNVLWVGIIGALLLGNILAAARHLARQNRVSDCNIPIESVTTTIDGISMRQVISFHETITKPRPPNSHAQCSGHTTSDMTHDSFTSMRPSFTSISTLSTSHLTPSLSFLDIQPTKTPTPPSASSTGHLTKTNSTETALGSAARVATQTSITVFTPSASANIPPSSLPQVSSESKLAVTAIALGAAVGAVLICAVILLSLCYWRRARREARFRPKPFLQRQSTKSPSHDALLEGAFTKERFMHASPLPDGPIDEEESPDSHGSQESTMVNDERDEPEEAALRRENERLRQENELLRLVARQATKGAVNSTRRFLTRHSEHQIP